MRKSVWLFFICLFFCQGNLSAQQNAGVINGVVVDSTGNGMEAATVSLLKAKDSSIFKITASIKTGSFHFEDIPAGQYFLSFSATGFIVSYSPAFVLQGGSPFDAGTIKLDRADATLQSVTITARKPLIELKAGKTLVNVDASVTNVGATALEVLEKSPGVNVDKDGNISLKGRQNVLVLIDDKPSYLPASELATMLSGMPASQLETIEIMTNPPAKYDAAGSTGVINIRTKKIKAKGFNGTFSTSYGQGRYYKNNNSLLLNYRDGKANYFLNYSTNANKAFTDLYALRSYYETNGNLASKLEQPSWFTGENFSHNIKGGIDYSFTKKTTVGFSITKISSRRKGSTNSSASWMDAFNQVDSLIKTNGNSKTSWENIGGNINLRHNISARQDLSADVDYLSYQIRNNQYFQNTLSGTGGYTERINGDLPSRIKIFSAKADYSYSLKSGLKMEAGWKSATVQTNNDAKYYYDDGSGFVIDYNKTNNFIYKENIHAAYVNGQHAIDRLTLQAGLRFETTSYDAEQRGNAQRKDSSFSRQYNSFFPTGFASYAVDSNNTFSISAGRRIDRPVFQKLNPFVFVINKYTYQKGNPYFRPQYTWNFELSHQYKDALVTTINYAVTKDYFSQIFYADSSTGLIIYTEGNLGRMRQVGLSVSSQLQLTKWWSLSAQANVNHKKIEGYVWNNRKGELVQFNANINNQFRFKKGWAAELSGVFVTSELELQETTEPTGQIGVGVSKQVMKNKGTVKLNFRDIFYTQAMKGLTTFSNSTEYFTLQRDTRVVNIAFTWRFGKPLKSAPKKAGSADEEIKRIGG